MQVPGTIKVQLFTRLLSAGLRKLENITTAYTPFLVDFGSSGLSLLEMRKG